MIRSTIQGILAHFGFQLNRIEEDGWSTYNLRKPGLSPNVVFDIGVNQGTPELYSAYPDAYFILVDPIKENEHNFQEILTQYKGEYLLGAAGAEPGTTSIHIEPSFVGRSSILQRTKSTSSGNELEERSIPITTIDEIVSQRNLNGPFGIKIDTEGFELEVIRGAGHTLRDSQFVIAEVSISKRFENGYVFADMISEMKKHGFHLSDVLSIPRAQRTREAMFVDVMFRPDSS